MPPTSTAILSASCDTDLLDRATAIAAVPFTWAPGDFLQVGGTYEAAT